MLACTKNCGSCRRFDRAFGGLSASVPEYINVRGNTFLFTVAIVLSSPVNLLHANLHFLPLLRNPCSPTTFRAIFTCRPLPHNSRLSPPSHKIPACHPLSHNSHLSPRTCCGVCLVTRYLLKKPELATLLDGPRNKCGVTSGECGVTD